MIYQNFVDCAEHLNYFLIFDLEDNTFLQLGYIFRYSHFQIKNCINGYYLKNEMHLSENVNVKFPHVVN